MAETDSASEVDVDEPHGTDTLFVARDSRRSVVSTSGVKIRGQQKHAKFGGITVVTGLPALSGKANQSTARVLAGAAVLAALVWCCAGTFGASGAVAVTISLTVGFGVGALMIAFPDSAGTVVARGAHISLAAPFERKTFDDALDLAERVTKTWPALDRLIDAGDARRLLVGAVQECARLLERREKISALLAEGSGGTAAGESAAARDLAAARKRADESRRRIDAELTRQVGYLTAAAEAGERLAHEQEMMRTADHIRAALDELSVDDPVRPLSAGEELSDRTAAVIAAYRELDAHYRAIRR